MKKLYSLFSAAVLGGFLLGGGVAKAQSYIDFTSLQDARLYNGFMPFAISPNGQYAAGATVLLEGFIYDFETQNVKVFNDEGIGFDQGGQFLLRAINNDGIAIGDNDLGLVRCTADGSFEVLDETGGVVYMIIAENMSADGSIIVGCVAEESWTVQPCYWDAEGNRTMLPILTEAEAGFRIKGGRAIGVSDDGSIIVGYLQDPYSTFPMVIWNRQSDGTYALDPVCIGKFEPKSEVIYDEWGREVGVENGPNPYLEYKPCALSADGNTIAMSIKPNTHSLYEELVIGLYDVKSGNLDLILDDPNNVVQEVGQGTFTISGVANDGTIVGTAGDMWIGAFPFMMDGETKIPTLLADAFPEFEELQEFEEEAYFGYPAFGTGISPNAQYMIGYGTKEQMYPVGFAFRIDRGTSSVKSIGQDLQNGEEAIYDLQGRRMNNRENLNKGIYIINGKKVAVK